MAIGIVDFPIEMVISHSYVSLPEGNGQIIGKSWENASEMWIERGSDWGVLMECSWDTHRMWVITPFCKD